MVVDVGGGLLLNSCPRPGGWKADRVRSASVSGVVSLKPRDNEHGPGAGVVGYEDDAMGLRRRGQDGPGGPCILSSSPAGRLTAWLVSTYL